MNRYIVWTPHYVITDDLKERFPDAQDEYWYLVDADDRASARKHACRYALIHNHVWTSIISFYNLLIDDGPNEISRNWEHYVDLDTLFTVKTSGILL